MIIYQSTKAGFQRDIEAGELDIIIGKAFKEKLFRNFLTKEADSWWNSLHYMYTIVNDNQIPNDVGIVIECQIPQTSKRIDFIITGRNENNKENIVIIELKQWKTAELTEKDAIVRTALGGRIRETNHPSYQAWTYADALQNFSAVVEKEDIRINACAYLHNYEDDKIIRNSFYKDHIEKAPLFLKRVSKSFLNLLKGLSKRAILQILCIESIQVR